MKLNGTIENKLRLLEEKLEEITSWNISSYDEFSQSSVLRNAVERALQVSIEIIIDVSERILALQKVPPRNSSAENIIKLEELGILKSSDKYIPMVKFRNFIVHRYEKIDPAILYDIVKNRIENFRAFIEEIRAWY